MNSIFDHINKSLEQQQPFVCYRKPNDTLLHGQFLKKNTLFYTQDFTEKGFVFAPFDNSKEAILFPLSESNFFTEKIDYKILTSIKESEINLENNFTEQMHVALVNKGLNVIQNTNLRKIVLSRKETITSDLDIVLAFKKLIHCYKNAFVYVWFHPEIGLWLGATPETLLKSTNQNFETMSLAGTQSFVEHKEVTWGNKELEEQQLVTNFIAAQLENITDEINISKTQNLRAGNLLHLKTEVSGKLKLNFNLKNLIRALHPTPAVCGFPRNEAKDFIIKNESYTRTFYTGFLGELNFNSQKTTNKDSHLFVNLRCMEVVDKEVAIFVGGGVTKESNAKKEWLETVAKSKTMKRVLISKKK